MQENNKSKKVIQDFWDIFQQLRILSKCCRTGHTVLQRVKGHKISFKWHCQIPFMMSPKQNVLKSINFEISLKNKTRWREDNHLRYIYISRNRNLSLKI